MSSIEVITEFTRYYLALFFSGVALFYAIRIVTKHKKGNAKVIHNGPPLSAHWINHLFFKLFRGLIWFVCVIRAINPAFDNTLGLIPALQNSNFILGGLVLLNAGFVFTVVAHYAMGKQWRSGIDLATNSRLITTGLFRFSRNPMYIGVICAQIGFFFALPSIFTLVCLIVGVSFIFRQTYLEESHLLDQHKEQYQQYKLEVRRWV